VEIGDAIQMKELPFVMGILANLSGKPEEALPKLKERKFVEIDRDNFNDVLESIGPRLAYRVDNKLADDDSKLNVELKFKNLDDFSPENVVHQVEPLRKLFEARQRLQDLLAKLDGNDDLDALLQQVAANTDDLQALSKQVEEARPEEAGDDADKEAKES